MLEIAGLRTTAVGAEAAPLVVVLLHGYAMQPADLTPFAHSLGLPALFLLPQGPQQSSAGGHGWWDIDAEARNAAVARGLATWPSNIRPDWALRATDWSDLSRQSPPSTSRTAPSP